MFVPEADAAEEVCGGVAVVTITYVVRIECSVDTNKIIVAGRAHHFKHEFRMLPDMIAVVGIFRAIDQIRRITAILHVVVEVKALVAIPGIVDIVSDYVHRISYQRITNAVLQKKSLNLFFERGE